MKQVILVTLFAVACGLAAIAQTGTPQPTPRSASPSTQPQMDQTQNPDMQTQSQIDNQKQNQTGGERKLKGCISSQGGNYMLQTKHGKEVPLAGSADFASHVGHTVTVHGMYSSNSTVAAPTASAAPTGSTPDNSASNGQFMVSKIEMVSDTCKDSKMKSDKGQ